MSKVRHVLGISGGKDSAALAIYLKRLYPQLLIEYYNTDTKCELAETNYIDIPDTPPHMSVKITVSIDARGFEGKSECRWIMVDSDNNDCFPNSNIFIFVVSTKMDYQGQTEVTQ